MPAASSAAERLAAHWVADALAADETIDFSVIKTLVGVSSEYLVGAPDATRERVSLRCLQELATFAVTEEGGDAAAAVPSGMLRVDAARSCEDVLVELTGKVGSSRSFDKDNILPFRQDIQNFISIKKPTLPETSLELLREVDPEIQSVVAPSPVDQNGIKKHDNNKSLSNANHLQSNAEKPRLPPVSAELLPEKLTEIGNFQQCPIEPTVDLDRPCASDSRIYNQPQEDAINAASVGARSPENSVSNLDSDIAVVAVPASASCNTTLQENIEVQLLKKDTVDKTTAVQSQACKGKSSIPNDDGTSYQSLKDPSPESQTVQATIAPAFDRSNDVLPTTASEASHLVNKDLGGSASTPPIEKDPIHEELILRAASKPSVTCNDAMQEHISGTNHPSWNTTEHTRKFEEQIGDKSQLEISCANGNNHSPPDDGTVLEKNEVCGGLNVQIASKSRSCNATLYDKISEANSLSKQNTVTNTTDVQKSTCSISVPNSAQDGDRKRAKQDSNKPTVGETVAEKSHVHTSDGKFSGFAAACLLSMTGRMPSCNQDQEANDSLGVTQEQDLCIKCGKDGQLLQCSSCLLSAHDSCFGSSVTFEDSGQFYCPVCICTKATEAYQKAKKTYIEARKNLAAFLGTEQLLKQHDEQQTGVLPRDANSEGQLNGHNSSKRQKSGCQTEANLAHQGEKSDQQRKKQKINVTSDAFDEVVIQDTSSVRNSDVAPMSKHSVLQNNRDQPHDAEKDHHMENTEARGAAGNVHSPHGRRNSSENRCSPTANSETEADKDDAPTNFQQSEESDEIETSSSNDSGKRSSPPWRCMKHHKARPQERETMVSSDSRKAFGQDKHMPSPSRKRKYACPPKRYSNPVVPTGRRSKLCWTEEEEAALREAMEKFTPRDNGAIPWVQILERGRDVFHRTRLPCDLRVKWRNMKKKAGS